MMSRHLSASSSTTILNSAKNRQWWHRWHYWSHLRVSPGSCENKATEPEDWSQWRENVQRNAGLLQEDAEVRGFIWNVPW